MIKKILLFILFSGITIVYAQNYGIGHSTINAIDASRNNRQVALEIFYPADSTGDDVPMSSDGSVFPVLSFGHGFVMVWSAYENVWTSLVPNGYIMAFCNTETGFAPNHLEFGKDLAFAIQFLRQKNSDPSSIFYNRVDSASCLMGHSMGGGASFLGAQFVNGLSAIANFAPAETNPSAVSAAAAIGVPSLILAGEKDCVTPPANNQIPMYNALASSCKTLVQFLGGTHCQFANTNVLCNLGEASCIPSGTIGQSLQHTLIDRYLIPWLNTTLKNDCAAGITFDSLLNNDPAIMMNNACTYCSNTTGISTISKVISAGPNPFTDSIVIRTKPGEKLSVKLLRMNGAACEVEMIERTNEIVIKTDHLAKGMYVLNVGSDSIKMVKN